MKRASLIAASVASLFPRPLRRGRRGPAAPAFTATDLAGKPVSLADFKGRTVVLEWHNFGARSCRSTTGRQHAGPAEEVRGRGRVAHGELDESGHQDYESPAALTKSSRTSAPRRHACDGRAGQGGPRLRRQVTPHMYVIDPSGKVA